MSRRMDRIIRILKSDSGNADELFFLLEPESVYEFVNKRNYEFRASFRMKKTTVETYEEFKDEVARYYEYHFTFGKPHISSFSKGQLFNMAENILSRYYGNGYVAFERTKKGIDGGLYGIFDKISEHFISDHRQKYIDHIESIFRKYDMTLIEDFFKRYFQRYGRYMDNQNIAYYLTNLREFISNHIRMVEQIK